MLPKIVLAALLLGAGFGGGYLTGTRTSDGPAQQRGPETGSVLEPDGGLREDELYAELEVPHPPSPPTAVESPR